MKRTHHEEEPAEKKQKTDSISHTLYLKNLNDKLNKDTLKKQLYYLMATFGDVVQVVVMKNSKMRGQAHVIFADATDAQIALKSLEGEFFFGKPLVLQFSRNKSRIIEQSI